MPTLQDSMKAIQFVIESRGQISAITVTTPLGNTNIVFPLISVDDSAHALRVINASLDGQMLATPSSA